MTFAITSITQDDLLNALAQGAVVATANARLSRSLSAAYERRMLARGRAAWATPAVLPLEAWLRQCFEDAALVAESPLPRVLGPEQEEQLWAGIIEGEGNALLRVDAAAQRARAAWKLLVEWKLPLADHRFGNSDSSAAFRRWAQRFESECRRHGCVSESAIVALMPALIAARQVPLPERLYLAGFHVLAPALLELAQVLQGAGCEVIRAEMQGEPGHAQLLRANDVHDEVAAATAWAREILESAPAARVGIVVPDLAARRPMLAHGLRTALDPAALAPGAKPAGRPWNISLGQSLSDYPVVATALGLLSLMQSPLELESLGVLLLSPYWAVPRNPRGRTEELDRRALLDRRLRALGDERVPLGRVRWQARGEKEDGSHRPWRCAALAERLERLIALGHELPRKDHTGAWAASFTHWLKTAGWAGCTESGRPLDSDEYQAVERWNELLSCFAGLEDFCGVLTRGAALGLLARLASGTLFQPRTGDAPVQVLGLYEAIGQKFDHLWVMGLHDGAWPPPAAPDPFIPAGMQRERKLPHSGPELELAWAEWMTAQLLAAAPRAVFSHPLRDGSQELGCSPLIAALPAAERRGLGGRDNRSWQERVEASAIPETVQPSGPVPLLHAEVSGGSAVFRDQALCPFKAFATHRLGARPLDRVQPGLDPKRRGSLLHEVLERLWQELGSQAGLLALGERELVGLVRAKIDEVLEERRRGSPATLADRFRAVEAERLQQQLLRWLEIERKRPPFTVTDLESLQYFETGGVRVRLKIDRVDELPDGARVVLDYKTGEVKPSAWFGERPDDPQLPLYAVASRESDRQGGEQGDNALAAVSFAQIRADEMAFRGVVRDGEVLPDLPPARNRPLKDASERWPAVLDEWAVELERLALAFGRGDTAVDPKNQLNTCRDSYCELAPLCRVREALPAADEEPGEQERSRGEPAHD